MSGKLVLLNETKATWCKSLVMKAVAADPRLKQKNCFLKFKGEAHDTPGDGWRATGQIFSENGTRLTSIHTYAGGSVIFSKSDQYPPQYHPPSDESAAQMADGPKDFTAQWIQHGDGWIVMVDGTSYTTHWDKHKHDWYFERAHKKYYYKKR